MTMTANASKNYTDEMISAISSQYTANPVRATVDALAEEFNKTPRSIIAKLSALGLYVKVERATKRGEPVVRKDELVAQVQASVGFEAPSLSKMTKVDLQNLINFFTTV